MCSWCRHFAVSFHQNWLKSVRPKVPVKSSILAQASLGMPFWTVGMGKACVDAAIEYSHSYLQFVAQDLPEPSAISM